jgi:glycosyltransferase involved in cell wall biosynthesis
VKTAILIPAFNVVPWNEAFCACFRAGCEELRRQCGTEVSLVFVDDGSHRKGAQLDDYVPVFLDLGLTATLLRHPINRGQGAALQTAIEVARAPAISADIFVTFDADGQHHPRDIVTLVRHLLESKVNIVFGDRFSSPLFSSSGIPAARKVILSLAKRLDRFITGLNLNDAHNGLRVFDRKTAEILDLRCGRMAHATEIKTIVRQHKLKYSEAPVSITYTQETLAQGQSNLNSVNILGDLLEEWWFA